MTFQNSSQNSEFFTGLLPVSQAWGGGAGGGGAWSAAPAMAAHGPVSGAVGQNGAKRGTLVVWFLCSQGACDASSPLALPRRQASPLVLVLVLVLMHRASSLRLRAGCLKWSAPSPGEANAWPATLRRSMALSLVLMDRAHNPVEPEKRTVWKPGLWGLRPRDQRGCAPQGHCGRNSVSHLTPDPGSAVRWFVCAGARQSIGRRWQWRTTRCVPPLRT